MSGRLRPVTLFNTSPVPFIFCALIGRVVSGALGEAGCSAHASPASNGKTSAVVRRFMESLPLQMVGKSSTAADRGGRNDYSTSARTFTCTAGRARPVARGDGPNPLRPTAPLLRNHPHPHARDSSRDGCAPLPSASWGLSHQDAAAVGYSGRVAYSFSVIVLRKERLRASATYRDVIPITINLMGEIRTNACEPRGLSAELGRNVCCSGSSHPCFRRPLR